MAYSFQTTVWGSIREAQRGRATAVGDFFGKYSPAVVGFIRTLGHSAEDAEDLAQEVFCRIFRALSGFEAKAKFFTYLYKVTLNLCLKEREREQRRRTYSLEEKIGEDEGPAREIEDPRGSAEDEVQRRDTSRIVREAILSLPQEQRTVVILHRYHDLSYEELAETLEISLAAVKSRLHRAKLALKERLCNYVADQEAASQPGPRARHETPAGGPDD